MIVDDDDDVDYKSCPVFNIVFTFSMILDTRIKHFLLDLISNVLNSNTLEDDLIIFGKIQRLI